MSQVIKTLNKHVTVRKFSDQVVSDEMLNTILNAARRSPTSSNRQTYSLVVVRDIETRRKLAVLAGNQKHIEECQVFVAFCADITRITEACAMHDVDIASGLEQTLTATIDAALVGQSVQTAAESMGLGAVMIGGMRNQPVEAAKLLGFPKGVYIVFGMSIGWPDMDNYPAQKPRLPEQCMIHYEQYQQVDLRPIIEQYDQDLHDHYEKHTSSQHASAWSGPIAKQLVNPRRPHLKSSLEALGFNLD